MTTRNKDEFARGGPAPGGLGEPSRRAMEDLAEGRQARATDEDVERAREKLGDTSGDGGGAIGAAQDGRATRQEDQPDEPLRGRDGRSSEDRRGNAREDDRERRLADARANEQDRLTRK